MANNYIKKRFIFKIYGISKEMVGDFKKSFLLYNYKVIDLSKIPIRKLPGKYTIVVNLTPKKNYHNLAKQVKKFLSKHKISKFQYGIHASLVTNRDSDGIIMPMHVTQFMNSFDCPCQFSFTCV